MREIYHIPQVGDQKSIHEIIISLCLPETTGHSQHFGVLYESISQSEPEIQALKVSTVTASSVEWAIIRAYTTSSSAYT